MSLSSHVDGVLTLIRDEKFERRVEEHRPLAHHGSMAGISLLVLAVLVPASMGRSLF